MKRARKTGAFIILAGLLFPLVFPLVLQINIQMIKVKARKNLEIASLQSLHIKKSEVQWTEKGEEIMINGRLFDIHSFELNKDELVVQGLYDDEEVSLNQAIEHSLHNEDPRQISLIQNCIQLFQLNYSSPQPSPALFPLFVSPLYDAKTSLLPQHIFIEIPSPPPQA